jgi:hypothetical protein
MNYKEKNEELKRVRGLFRQNYPEGCVKVTRGESRLHRQIKCDICGWLKENNFKFWTEPNLINNSGRPDIICLHSNGSAYIIEVIVSENGESINLKSNKYPLSIIVIDASKFDYIKFCL